MNFLTSQAADKQMVHIIVLADRIDFNMAW